MIAALRRALLRRYYASLEIRWKHEVSKLLHEESTHAERLDKALRNVSAARLNRVFLDIRRPPISSAPGRGLQDGVQRFSVLTPGERP